MMVALGQKSANLAACLEPRCWQAQKGIEAVDATNLSALCLSLSSVPRPSPLFFLLAFRLRDLLFRKETRKTDNPLHVSKQPNTSCQI